MSASIVIPVTLDNCNCVNTLFIKNAGVVFSVTNFWLGTLIDH